MAATNRSAGRTGPPTAPWLAPPERRPRRPRPASPGSPGGLGDPSTPETGEGTGAQHCSVAAGGRQHSTPRSPRSSHLGAGGSDRGEQAPPRGHRCACRACSALGRGRQLERAHAHGGSCGQVPAGSAHRHRPAGAQAALRRTRLASLSSGWDPPEFCGRVAGRGRARGWAAAAAAAAGSGGAAAHGGGGTGKSGPSPSLVATGPRRGRAAAPSARASAVPQGWQLGARATRSHASSLGF